MCGDVEEVLRIQKPFKGPAQFEEALLFKEATSQTRIIKMTLTTLHLNKVNTFTTRKKQLIMIPVSSFKILGHIEVFSSIPLVIPNGSILHQNLFSL